MPVVSEMVHPSGLSFVQQRQVVIRRKEFGESFSTIAAKVKNLSGGTPTPRTCNNYFKSFSSRVGRVRTKYSNCGRHKWKFTPEVQRFLIQKLREFRSRTTCTSTTLQALLAKEKRKTVSCSAIRKVLNKHGYKWLPRRQKPKFTKEVMKLRLQFAKKIVRMSMEELKEAFDLAMDGVNIHMPPKDTLDRLNFVKHGDDHMWRKPSESFNPRLAGKDDYPNQVPLARSVPLWGGCSCKGFSVVLFHPRKKLNSDDWVRAVDSGKLRKAITDLHPVKRAGPWTVLCDNESFLETDDARAAHGRARVKLWHIPPKSPDLNPVERFWSDLRRRLRQMDLKDLLAKKPVPSKQAYKARVRALLKTKAVQTSAANTAKGLKKVCKLVVKKKGAASGK